MLKITILPKGDFKKLKSDVWPFRIIQILWNGDVVPCTLDFDRKILMGEVRKSSVKEVWNGMQYRGSRQIHRERDYQKSYLCKTYDRLREV